MNFLSEQMDFIHFVTGLGFLMLGATCLTLAKEDGKRLPWIFLGIFGALQALKAWLIPLSQFIGESLPLSAVTIGLKIASFLFLMEFGRKGLLQVRGKGPGPWIYALFGLGLLFGGLVWGIEGFDVFSRYVLCLTACAWAAIAMFAAAGGLEPGPRRQLGMVGTAIALFALPVAASPCYPSLADWKLVNLAGYAEVPGAAVYALAAVLSACAALALWGYSFSRDRTVSGQKDFRFPKYRNLFLLAIVLTLSIGWGLTQYLDTFGDKGLKENSESNVSNFVSVITGVLNETDHVATILARSPFISTPLSGNARVRPETNSALDRYSHGLRDSVCYVLDRTGKTVASSNRDRPDSFVGKSFAFRPYFKEAISGKPGWDLALETTSGARSYYTSFPLRGAGQDPIGVAVIKRPLSESLIHHPTESIFMLIDPNGVIFLSSKRELLYRALWPMADETRKSLIASKRFGPGSFLPVLAQEPANGGKVFFQGRTYHAARKGLDRAGWSFVYLQPTTDLIIYRLFGITLTFGACVLIIFFHTAFLRFEKSAVQIARSHALLASTIESTADGILVVDQKGKIEKYNQKFLEMWGGPEEILSSGDGKRMVSYIMGHVKDPDALRLTIRNIVAETTEERLNTVRYKDGRLFKCYSIPRHAEGKSAGRVWSIRDITEWERAVEEITWSFHTQQIMTEILQLSLENLPLSEKLRRTLSSIFRIPWLQAKSKGAIFLVEGNPETLVMAAQQDLSPDIKSICGKISFGECLCGKTALSRKVIFTRGGYENQERFCNRGETHGHYCVPILSDDRVLGVINLHMGADHEETDREKEFLTDVCNILTGMIERDRAEKDLQRLATAVEQAGEIFMITNTKGDIQYVNPAFERVTGYRCVEAVGNNPRILKSGVQDESFYKEMWSTLLRGEVWNGRFTNRRKDGTLYEQETVISPVRGASGRVVNYVGVMRDTTKEVQLSEQLRQSQKMEAIGTLAGGVAHDFNNLLTAIQGYSDFLLTSLGENSPLSADIREIQKAADRATSLTRQLLAFSRMQVFQPVVLDLNKLVANMRKMLKRLLGENIELVTIPGTPLGRVKADAGQIEQVILNLVMNARDAMPNGGRIIIETSNKDLDESFARKQVNFRPGPYVMLAVTDEGIGMDKKTMSRIFEPFFTTKEQGKGTGLGLSVAYGIVKQHNGFIHPYSEPRKGTTFRVHLPAVDAPSDAIADTRQELPLLGGTETVLLVEDTELVRNLVREVLTRYRYRVLEASDGNEALLLCRQHEEPIHLLLTDVMMPGISGTELAKTISSSRPGIKVLCMSGYTEFGPDGNAVLPGGSFFIQKPFSTTALARKVREVLDG